MIAPGGIVGNAGGPYKTYKGAQNVHLAEVHTNIVNELFNLHPGITTTLTAAVSAGDTQVTVVNSAIFSVGSVVEIHNGVTETTFPIITALPGANVLVLDRPLDFNYIIGDVVELVHTDLSTTAGTLAAPISHHVRPESGQIWYINRIIMAMTHGSASTDDRFGDLAALTNGVVLRVTINGRIFTYTNWKANSDIILDMFDVVYSSKSGPSLFGTSGRGSFSRIGSLVRLDGSNGDFMEILIQDDVTALNSFFVNAQGYIEDAS